MKNNESKKNKKFIIGGTVAALAIAGSVVMVGGDFFEKNENKNDVGTDIVKPANEKVTANYSVEYGEKLEGSSFLVDGMSVKLDNLEPKVNSMSVGKTEHKTTLNGKELLVTVSVVDTKSPEFAGIQDYSFPKGTDLKNVLKSKISASDKVDGVLEYTLTAVEKDAKTEVTALAVDKNGNETKEIFNVTLVDKVASGDKEGDKVAVDTDSKNPSNSNGVNSGSNGNTNSNPNGSTKPADTKPTPQPAPAPKPVEPKPVPKPTPAPTPAPKPVEPKPAPTPAPKPVEPKPAPTPAPKPVEPKPTPTPAPKPVEPKPTPKPVEPTPKPSDKVVKVKDVPGATLTGNSGLLIKYNYTKSLPSGGKISSMSIGITHDNNLEAFAIGVDSNGTKFLAGQEKGSDRVTFQYAAPNLSEDDMNEIKAALKAFNDSHKAS